MHQPLPDYEIVNQALTELEGVGTAAEAHGLLCALFSSGVNVRREAWIDGLVAKPLSPGDGKATAAYKVLSDLYNQTQNALSEMDDFGLELLLPDDEESFAERIKALVHWAQGFVSGLSSLGIEANKEQGEVAEAIKDLSKIACLEHEAEIGDEEGENAYVELIEYTRIAVILLHDELRSRFTKTTKVSGNNTMH